MFLVSDVFTCFLILYLVLVTKTYLKAINFVMPPINVQTTKTSTLTIPPSINK